MNLNQTNQELSANTTLSHYRIVSKIGAGGMGEVYLAQDTKLDRQVALKILPADLAANRDRMRRFVQEAKAAAALNHPNIAHIYEIGEADGVNFIAMEFVDGETLREKIHQAKSGLRVLLRHLLQVAEGLAKAHSSGIVHRDLKPDNIMITHDGHAKILDFGLAKLVETSGPRPGQSEGGEAPTAVMQQHSIPGMIMGTVGYMSPEQARAKTVDQRSDIFSFGCILYEAATGRKPFAGDSTIDTLHKIIYEPALAITDFNPSASPELQRVIRKCLAKEPEKRYQTIRDVANDLEELLEEMKGVSDIERSVAPSSIATTSSAIGSTDGDVRAESTVSVSRQPASSAESVITGIKQHKLAVVIALLVLVVGTVGLVLYLHARTTEAAIESIAVMPFVNEGGNAEQEYLADGITESLINSLSQLPNVKVMSRNSVFRYKGKETDTRKVGSELNVRALLTGSVKQVGDQLFINISLDDTQDNHHIWGEQYNRKQSDLISLQSELARDVSSKLRVKLSGVDEQKLTKTYTVNTEAYQLYLKGRFYWNKRTGESLKQAVEFYNQAIEKDPNYALAYSGLAESYVLFSFFSVALPQDSMPKARAAAMRALEIDDSLAEAHAALALYLSLFSWNQPAAERELRRAIELKPNYPTAHHWLGNTCLLAMQRFAEAVAEGRRAEDLDPLSPIISADLGNNLFSARRYDEAIEQLKHALALDPNFYFTHYSLGLVYHARGMNPEAIAEYRRALELNDDPFVRALLARSLAKSGRRGEAIKMLDQLKSESARRYVQSVGFAVVYAALGEKDEAFVWLEKDFAERSLYAPYYAENPLYDDLRDDPRFQDLVRRVASAKKD